MKILVNNASKYFIPIECPSGQTAVGQECRTLVSTVGGTRCSSDLDCTPANTFCNSGRCDCINGATRSGNSCVLSKEIISSFS